MWFCFVPRRRQILWGSTEVECLRGFEHQMCIGDISNMKNESYETFQFIAMYLSCPCCFNSISTTHPLTFKNNITSNEIKINQHSSTSTSYPTIRLDSICSLNQCILSVEQDQKSSFVVVYGYMDICCMVYGYNGLTMLNPYWTEI